MRVQTRYEEPLVCPSCGCKRGKVIETREMTFHGIFFIMRTRRCDHCGFQFRSKETRDDSIVDDHRSLSQENEAEAEKAVEDIPTIDETKVSHPLVPDDDLPDKSAEDEKFRKRSERQRRIAKKAGKKLRMPDPDEPPPMSTDIFPPVTP